MNASMRKIGALCSKDFRDLFKNPQLLVCCLLPIAFSAFYRFMMGKATEGVDLSAAGPEAAGRSMRRCRASPCRRASA